MTINEAVKKHKLDRRTKWFAFYGMVTKNQKYTTSCSGCSCDCSDGHGCNHGNSGCSECGYTGKRISSVPVSAFDKKGEIIPTSSKDFTYASQ